MGYIRPHIVATNNHFGYSYIELINLSYLTSVRCECFSSVSPTDFAAISQTISFSIGDTSHTVRLSITNDEICESPNEGFFVDIALASGVQPITISPSRAQVVINDGDEPECSKTISINSSL